MRNISNFIIDDKKEEEHLIMECLKKIDLYEGQPAKEKVNNE